MLASGNSPAGNGNETAFTKMWADGIVIHASGSPDYQAASLYMTVGGTANPNLSTRASIYSEGSMSVYCSSGLVLQSLVDGFNVQIDAGGSVLLNGTQINYFSIQINYIGEPQMDEVEPYSIPFILPIGIIILLIAFFFLFYFGLNSNNTNTKK